MKNITTLLNITNLSLSTTLFIRLYVCLGCICVLFSFFVCEHVSAAHCRHTSVLFVAAFVNVTQDRQIERAIVSAGGQQECI